MIKKSVYIFYFLIFLLFSTLVIYLFINSDYTKIEKKHNFIKTNALLHQLDRSMEDLFVFSSDYSHWDETYSFIENFNEEYIDSNIGDSEQFLKDVKMSFFVFFKINSKNSYYSLFRNAFSKDDINTIEKKLINTLVNKKEVKTFFIFKKRVFFISKTIITNNNGTKKENAYLFTGKEITNKSLKSLTYNLKKIEINNNILNTSETLKKVNSRDFYNTYSNVIIKGEVVSKVDFYDLNKNYLFSLKLISDLDFSEQKNNTIYIFIFVLMIFLAIIFIILYKQSERLTKIITARTSDLTESNEKYKKITLMFNDSQKIAHIGNYDYNLKTKKVIWSEEHYRILGKEVNSFSPISDDFFKFIHKEDFDFVKNFLKKCIDLGSVTPFVYRIILEDGTLKYVKSSCGVSKRDEEGKPLVLSGTIMDITNDVLKEESLKRKEKLLLEQAKRASMGEMLSNISHQLKQPLSLVSILSSSIKMKKELGILDDDEIVPSMTEISFATEHLSNTIDDFKNFFSPNKKTKDIYISKIIKKALCLVSSQFVIDEINIIDTSKDIKINIFDNELLQVLLNLLNNSRDALRKINTNRFIFIDSLVVNNYLILNVKDNAGGINIKDINTIFDEYMTTKKDENGTGIGLYMSKKIVENSLKGEISVHNETFEYKNVIYTGAFFIIKIPL